MFIVFRTAFITSVFLRLTVDCYALDFSNIANDDLCRFALNETHDNWETDARYKDYVKAAKSKKLTLSDCNLLRNSTQLDTVSVSETKNTSTKTTNQPIEKKVPLISSSWNQSTSTLTRSKYSCDLRSENKGLTRGYLIEKPLLTYPQRNYAAWKLVGKIKGMDEYPWFSDVNTFVDLGGDGLIENVTKVYANVKPNRLLPIFVWPEDKDNIDSINEFGVGSEYGVELKYKNLSKILVSDLNGDGVDDLVFLEYGEHDYDGHANEMGGSIDVALSIGKSKKYKAMRLVADDNSWHQGVLIDMFGTGNLDIVAVGGPSPKSSANGNENFINVLKNDGRGNFKKVQFPYGPLIGALAAAGTDVDGDGKPDLIVATSKQHYATPDTLHIFWGGGGTPLKYQLKKWNTDPIVDIAVSDLSVNRDGDLFLLIGGKNYTQNVVEAVSIQNRKVQSEKTIFNQPNNTVDGPFHSLGEIIVCDGSVYTFLNSSISRASFFKLSP